MNDEQWVLTYRAQGMTDANIIAGKLKSAGIPVTFDYEAVGHIYGLTLDGLGEVRLYVPRGYEEQATAVIEERFTEEDIGWEDGE